MTHSKKRIFYIDFFFGKVRDTIDASEHLSLKTDDIMIVKIIVISIYFSLLNVIYQNDSFLCLPYFIKYDNL